MADGSMMLGAGLSGALAKPARQWRVVVSKPGAERLAKQQIENQGFEVYLPMAVSEVPPSKSNPKGGLKVRPFLRGYLFVRVDETVDRWRCLLSTLGVKSIILIGERPAPVSDRIVNRIRDAEEGGLIKLLDPRNLAPQAKKTPVSQPRFKTGDACKFKALGGDIEAIFDTMIDEDRCRVFITFLGAERQTTCTLASIA